MVGARSVIKLFVPLLLLATMMFASVEARRAYQTTENQDDTQVTDTLDGPVVVVVPKRQAQFKPDKAAHQAPTLAKAVTDKKEQSVRLSQFLSSPLDCMIQYEKDHHAGLESQSTEPALVTPATAQENIVSNNTHETNRPSGLPIDIAVTAIAIGVCCYAFSRKFLYKAQKAGE